MELLEPGKKYIPNDCSEFFHDDTFDDYAEIIKVPIIEIFVISEINRTLEDYNYTAEHNCNINE